ncbi:DUF1918 domain-containing protein [Streptacidiphilus carbonis]|jgi:hypothetical protein|uniref:DUF1918 domain-containing protein n=1 Tax=Streptacidiphilus carbonis TaxID=105422 RepID=UPI0005A6EBDD|nr:DUF1918 domain-containing protein [Streptacidiphilus carbonis]
MKATVGDRLRFHGRHVGTADRLGRVTEVRGKDGQPPYLVEFDDGHKSEVYPGTDCQIEPAATAQHPRVTDPGQP